MLAILAGVRRFLERHTFADSLESITAFDSTDALTAWRDAAPPQRGDLRAFLHLCARLDLVRLGRGPGRFMSVGGPGPAGSALFKPGLWDGAAAVAPRALDLTRVSEDTAHSWMRGAKALHPAQGVTVPDADKVDAYSWCKAPRLAGQPVEVGALARQLIDGHPLVRDLICEAGANVQSRVVGRLVESARLVIAMEQWVRDLRPTEPFYVPAEMPDEGFGTGLAEAARGSLGHWLQVRHGRIINYQIIAPTTWNFSPRDSHGTPGPLEQSLVGTPVRAGEPTPIAVQHVVRSFDPCMVCTVH